MATIERTYGADGRVEVEPLYHMLFTLEKGAHTFVITLENGDVLAEATDVFARFRRSDGQTVHIVGTLSSVTATVTLPETCYNAPGPFGLSIFVTNEAINAESGGDVDPMTVCVYACAGQVATTTTDDVITEETTPSKTMEEMIADVKADIAGAHQMAVWAVNIGNIEGQVDTFNETVDGIVSALAEADVRALNTPNLIPNQEFFTNSGGSNFPFGEAKRWYGSERPWVKSIRRPTETTYTEEPADKGDSWYREIDSVDPSTGAITYKDVWHVFKDEDEIRTSVADLGDAGAIHDTDGAVYRYALQFAVTGAESGYHNSEDLIFNHGNDGGTREVDGQQVPYGPSGVLDMTDGETYTLSCWARITAGTKARLVLKYGMSAGGYGLGYDGENQLSLEIAAPDFAAWKRVSWTFVYHSTDHAGNAGGWKKRVAFGVCRKYTATVQLCGFRLTKGGLYGSNTVDTLQAHINDQNAVIAALTARVEALERG